MKKNLHLGDAQPNEAIVAGARGSSGALPMGQLLDVSHPDWRPRTATPQRPVSLTQQRVDWLLNFAIGLGAVLCAWIWACYLCT